MNWYFHSQLSSFRSILRNLPTACWSDFVSCFCCRESLFSFLEQTSRKICLLLASFIRKTSLIYSGKLAQRMSEIYIYSMLIFMLLVGTRLLRSNFSGADHTKKFIFHSALGAISTGWSRRHAHSYLALDGVEIFFSLDWDEFSNIHEHFKNN